MKRIYIKRAGAALVALALVLHTNAGVLPVLAAQGTAQTVKPSAETQLADAGETGDAPTVESAETRVTEEIHLSDAAALVSFAENCRLDTWSQTRKAVLDNDIDLNGLDFAGIATFGGVFDGQGHTITNLSMTGSGSYQGLFRYVQTGAVIENLSLTAVVMPGGSEDKVGGLAGSNSGTLRGCTVRVVVRGGESVGGVVGVNNVSGVITDCTSKGIVYGEHFVGGVVGDNEGLVSGSRSYCSVNTTEEQNDIDLSTLTVADLTGTENAATITDIGGIAGGNAGVLRACINNGAVGYYHIGYNVGGIAGSQTGFVEGCINYGTVSGRKEVGGIIGQMEPSSQLQFTQDRLQQAHEELVVLQGLVNKACNDASGATASVSNQLNSLRNQVNAAVSSSEQMMGSVTDAVQNSQNTDISKVVDSVLPTAMPTNLPTLPPEVSDLVNSLTGQSTESASAVSYLEPVPQPTPQPAAAPAEGAAHTSSLSLTNLSAGGKASFRTVSETDVGAAGGDGTAAGEGTPAGDDTPADAPTPPPEITVPTVPPEVTLPTVPPDVTLPTVPPDVTLPTLAPDTALPTVPPDVTLPTLAPDTALPTVPPDATLPTLAPDTPVPTLAPGAVPTISPEELDNIRNSAASSVDTDAIIAAQNALSGNISQAMAALSSLNGSTANQTQTLIADIQAINMQMAKVGQTLTGTTGNNGETVVEDISGEDSDSDTSGKVSNCINTAAVQGDLNIGGIAGAMAVENDLDPEDDVNVTGDLSLNVTLRSRVVLRGCTNTGSVLAKKTVAGGIVGQQEMGLVKESTSRCSVTVESGDNTGGIAGLSKAEIRDCFAKCRLSGNAGVGGIAGEGATISGCYAMLEIDEGSEKLGSIAGSAEDVEQLSGNYYTASKWGAVDNISYAGRGEALAYDDFSARDGIPAMFRVMTLTFMVNGAVVDTRSCAYGGSIDVDTLPEIMQTSNKRQVWPDGYYDDVTFDQNVEAVDAPNCSVLESTLQRGARPIVLAEGMFGTEDALTLREAEGAPFGQAVLDKLSLAVGGVTLTVKDGETQTALETWEIVLPDDGETTHRIRYLPSQDAKNVQIYLKTGDGWTAVDSTQNGSYLRFDVQGSDIVFCAATKATQTVPPLLLAAGILVFLLLCIVRIIGRHRRRAQRRAAAAERPAPHAEAEQTDAAPKKKAAPTPPKEAKARPVKKKSFFAHHKKTGQRDEGEASQDVAASRAAAGEKPAVSAENAPSAAPSQTPWDVSIDWSVEDDADEDRELPKTRPAENAPSNVPETGAGGVWGHSAPQPAEPARETGYRSFAERFGEAYDDEEPPLEE